VTTMNENDPPGLQPGDKIVRFPQTRVSPRGANRPFRNLGLGPMAKTIGAPLEQATGHWCSHCRGIWYGYLLEVACPVCGNRHG
jgi:hypothetical protein